MAKVRKIKGREGYHLDYRLKDGSRIIKKASRDNRRGAERELALIVSEIETRPGLKRLKKIGAQNGPGARSEARAFSVPKRSVSREWRHFCNF